MAISSEFFSERNRPYVHSNFSNFQQDVIKQESSEDFRQYIDKTISELQNLQRQLSNEAIVFAHGYPDLSSVSIDNVGELMTKKFFYSNNDDIDLFRAVGIDVLRSNAFLNAILSIQQTINLQNITFLTRGKVEEIFSDSEVTEIPISQALDKIMASMDSKRKKNIETFTQGLLKSLGGFDKEFIKSFTKSNNRETMRKKIRELLKQKASTKDDVIRQQRTNEAKSKFATLFREHSKIIQLGPNKKVEIDKYIMGVQNNMDTYGLLGERANLQGQAGEELLVAVSTVNNGLQLEVTGAMSEQQIKAELEKRGKTLMDLKTFHREGKQSQSDLLLTNPAGKTVRIQAKNIQSVLDAIIKGENRPMYATIDSSKNFLDLLNRLEQSSNNFFNGDEADKLAYYAANVSWFSHHQDIETKSVQSTSEVKRLIEQNLTAAVTDLMGIDVDYTFTPENLVVSGANIFYIFANSIIVPTSKIIENLIIFLKQQEKSMSGLSVSFHGGEPLPKYKNAQIFHKAKINASSGEYGTETLEVGKDQGQNIMATLGADIKLRMSLSEAIRSSYNGFFNPS